MGTTSRQRLECARFIAAVGEQPKEDRAECGHDPPDVVAEAGTGRAEQCREQRRQIHRVECKQALEEADDRQPRQPISGR